MARITTFAVFSLALCQPRLALANEPASIPPATTGQIHQTVDRAIGYMQSECAAWLKTRGCAACHHVPMPLWALSEAERQGYAIDKKFLVDTTESLLGSRDKLLSSRIFPNPADPPDPRPSGRGLNMGLPYLAVAARSFPSLEEGQQQSLKFQQVHDVNRDEDPDLSWAFTLARDATILRRSLDFELFEAGSLFTKTLGTTLTLEQAAALAAAQPKPSDSQSNRLRGVRVGPRVRR